ncbi:MAG: PP2C family protein-serine/threonine phosphatase [Candidatus Sulfotelmatobacter sp.]|jgi:serine phosphatase RsbU (regulator of sigma subunit)
MHSLFHSRDNDAVQPVEPVPTVFPPIQGADIAALFVGKRIAGDFYDSIRVSPERVLIGLLDMAGRREDNRKLLTTAQSTFRTVGTQLFSGQDINEADAMTELCLHLNRGLIEGAEKVLSCPALIACYHEKFGTLCYANAGHTPALLRDDSGIAELGSTGLPLGLFSHATAEARIVGLERGALLLLVSKGVVACEGRYNRSLEEFGLDRVKGLLEKAQPAGATDLCDSVLRGVADFSEGAPACDDRTALALIRTA